MKKIFEIFLMLLLSKQIISYDFTCSQFKSYSAKVPELANSEVELDCPESPSEDYTLLEIKFEGRKIIESRLYKQQETNKDEKTQDEIDYEEEKLDCFEVKSMFSSTSYNHFQCSPAPEITKNDEGVEQ